MGIDRRMEKRVRMSAIKDVFLLQYRYVAVSVLLLGFIVMDPFDRSPEGGHDFKPITNEIESYRKVVREWPWDNRSRLGCRSLEFEDEIFSPESLEFDPLGRGPYAGLADGRIVRWMGDDVGWKTFAVVTPRWTTFECGRYLNLTAYKKWKLESKCGRPLGIRFESKTGQLYIADAYYGLLVVGPQGGIATSLATQTEDGEPIIFANDLDIHANGSVFFTDMSNRYNRVDHFLIMLEGETKGRLLRYDPHTKQTHIVLNGLSFPNGVQLSKDQSTLLFTETINCRIMKYIMEGPERGKTELFVNLPGYPDNIRRIDDGKNGEMYWVAIDCCRTAAQEILIQHPWVRAVYFRLPFPMRYLTRVVGMRLHAMIALLDESGRVVDALEDDKNDDVMKLVSEVRQVDGKLWIGSVANNHVATLSY